jgi:hypothetical protein
MLRRRRNLEFWRFAPLLPDNAAIYGIVGDGVIGARVTVGKLTAQVDARENVIGGVLPLPYEDGVSVDLIRRPAPSSFTVGLVDAGGNVERAARRIRRTGYETLGAIVPGVKSQRRTVVYCRPREASMEKAAGVAKAVRADEIVRTQSAARIPRPVLDSAARVVVVVGR